MTAVAVTVALSCLLLALCLWDRHDYQRVYFGVIEALAERPHTSRELRKRLGRRVYRVIADLDDDRHIEPDFAEATVQWRIR